MKSECVLAVSLSSFTKTWLMKHIKFRIFSIQSHINVFHTCNVAAPFSYPLFLEHDIINTNSVLNSVEISTEKHITYKTVSPPVSLLRCSNSLPDSCTGTPKVERSQKIYRYRCLPFSAQCSRWSSIQLDTSCLVYRLENSRNSNTIFNFLVFHSILYKQKVTFCNSRFDLSVFVCFYEVRRFVKTPKKNEFSRFELSLTLRTSTFMFSGRKNKLTLWKEMTQSIWRIFLTRSKAVVSVGKCFHATKR